jgi:catechol 2,3-dioxygenase-like lactoylglutathione lyase family enzyme
MPQSLAHIALIVRDYDEAIDWFVQKLGFTLVADQYQPEQDKRWVLVAPPGAGENRATLLLARAASPEQARFIGNQAGGRVFLFLKTDDFDRDYEAYRARGVRFVRPAAEQPYGKVAVFEDLYGNLWAWCSSPANRRSAPPRLCANKILSYSVPFMF